MNRLHIVLACLAIRVLLDAALVHAEEPTAEELAQQDQNPITRFIVPLVHQPWP